MNTVGVRFKKSGKIYNFDSLDLDIKVSDGVIVETSRGIEFGRVVILNKSMTEKEKEKELKPVIRIADEMDIEIDRENKKKAKDAFDICKIKIEEHGLDMKLIECEYTFDNSRLIFYFAAEDRIDFRDLVKELAQIFKTRIELRQIGVRDEAKYYGALGMCGQECCCSRFLGDFTPVSIKMAKDQDLSLNPTKISGVCGRLLCCLNYEHEGYVESRKEMPKVGDIVNSPNGSGLVKEINPLTKEVKLEIKGDNDISELFTFKNEELLREHSCKACKENSIN